MQETQLQKLCSAIRGPFFNGDVTVCRCANSKIFRCFADLPTQRVWSSTSKPLPSRSF